MLKGFGSSWERVKHESLAVLLPDCYAVIACGVWRIPWEIPSMGSHFAGFGGAFFNKAASSPAGRLSPVKTY